VPHLQVVSHRLHLLPLSVSHLLPDSKRLELDLLILIPVLQSLILGRYGHQFILKLRWDCLIPMRSRLGVLQLLPHRPQLTFQTINFNQRFGGHGNSSALRLRTLQLTDSTCLLGLPEAAGSQELLRPSAKRFCGENGVVAPPLPSAHGS